MDVMYDERSDQPVPRAAAPKPTGPNGENLTQWAIKIVVKFREDWLRDARAAPDRAPAVLLYGLQALDCASFVSQY